MLHLHPICVLSSSSPLLQHRLRLHFTCKLKIPEPDKFARSLRDAGGRPIEQPDDLVDTIIMDPHRCNFRPETLLYPYNVTDETAAGCLFPP